MQEIWKDIIGFEGLYQVSNYGNIKSLERRINVLKTPNEIRIVHSRILKNYNCKGYLHVRLQRNNIGINKKVHRLVAIHFIDNPENKQQVNHKDGNKLNNYVDNLQWVTNLENSIHAFENKIHHNPKKSIIQLDLNNNFISEYESIAEAAKITGINNSAICSVANKKYGFKTAGGFIFRFKNYT